MIDDGLPDDRITCSACRHCNVGAHHCHRFRTSTLEDLPRRCIEFLPLKGAADVRRGLERWPTLQADIEEARALDAQRAF